MSSGPSRDLDSNLAIYIVGAFAPFFFFFFIGVLPRVLLFLLFERNRAFVDAKQWFSNLDRLRSGRFSGISREESCQTYITSVLVSLRVGRSEEGLSRF